MWSKKIEKWASGKIQKYPKKIKNRFYFETFVCDKLMKNKYDEVFIENNELDNLEEDYTPFRNQILKSKNKYVVSFWNISNDCLLIIPMPRKNKKFTTIKDFMDNASEYQQRKFWIKTAHEIIKVLETNDKIYISTHGTGVSYFHLRLDKYPKYYQTTKFI